MLICRHFILNVAHNPDLTDRGANNMKNRKNSYSIRKLSVG
ncbi:YSIRK-type signal peptide-containing protein, partial [Staphylococcus capitis]